jgi:DNA-binding transcriptional MocR family regulator
VSVDAQFRAFTIINSIINDKGKFFPFIKSKILLRSQMLKNMLREYGKGRIEIISPDGFVVVWLRCHRLGDCGKFFESLKISINPGETYGADPSYARFNLQGEYTDFMILLKRLETYLKNN